MSREFEGDLAKISVRAIFAGGRNIERFLCITENAVLSEFKFLISACLSDLDELLEIYKTSVERMEEEIKEEFSKLTTGEVANGLGPNDMVIDSKMSEADLEHSINATAGGLDHGYLDEFWENFHPLIPLLIIAATQGYRVAVNKDQVSDAMEVAKARAARGVVASAAGALIKTVSGSWLASALGAVTAGMFFDRSQNIDELAEAMRSRNRLLAARAKQYQTLVARA